MTRGVMRLVVSFLVLVSGGCSRKDADALSHESPSATPPPVAASTEPLIAFVAFDGVDEHKVCVVHADGQGLRWLAHTTDPSSPPSWSPDRASLVFRGETGIEAIDVASGQVLTLVADPQASGPVWSPAGGVIAFEDSQGGISAVSPTGEDLKVLVRSAAGVRHWAVSWHPDGGELAFWSTGKDDGRVTVVTLDTGEVRRVTPTGGWGPPSWSPDGARIAVFSVGSEPSRGSRGVCLIDTDTLAQETVTLTEVSFAPKWRPDGLALLIEGPVFDLSRPLYSLDLASGSLALLTQPPRGNEDTMSTWSPDGSRICFVRQETTGVYDEAKWVGSSKLMLLSPATGQVDQLAPSVDMALSPSW